MNIQQFQYVIAVAEFRHFQEAADKCFITQSTLSTMIGRLEEELGVKIFDRKTKPVSITKEGKLVIEKLRIIIKDVDELKNMVEEMKGSISGELQIGIIPTVTPYLLPLFLSEFAKKYPKVKIVVQEMTTTRILEALKKRTLDIGIAAIPLVDNELREEPLYQEPFMLFDCLSSEQRKQSSVQQIDFKHLWLLQEGHCLRTQVEQICELSNTSAENVFNFEFKAGSMDSLIRFTKSNNGITLLPYLSTLDMNQEDKKRLSNLEAPVPVRSIGLIVHQHFVKQKLLGGLKEIIISSTKGLLPEVEQKRIIDPVA